jgi:hypothetical protein
MYASGCSSPRRIRQIGRAERHAGRYQSRQEALGRTLYNRLVKYRDAPSVTDPRSALSTQGGEITLHPPGR